MARILVVDDEEGLREFLSDTLEAAGHTVERAADGEMAYRILGSRAFHVLVTDLKMPGIDGMELVRRTRREQPEMEVVVLTAHGSVAGAVEAMKLGAFDYLEKPIPSPAALRLVVDRALERRGLHAIEEHVAEASAPPRLGYGSRVMQEVETALRKVAPTDATVLLLGESGTGKEVAARFLHAHSKRAKGPFVAVNCATLSEQLLESELFGHEKGAFSGAIAKKRGKLELAEGGTFFLDEIGEMKLELQTKLLRVLQERRFERVGGTCSIDADARFIAATNRDLMSEIHTGRFREDLYHRLAVFPVRMPPLRERPEDVSHLADVLLARIARDLGRPGLSLDERARGAIVAADFPGNVRELRNALERAAILAESTKLTLDDITRVLHGPSHEKPAPVATDAPTMEEAEQTAIRRALAQCGGNRKKAAEHLGIGLRTLYEKLKKYGIR
ncbi:MAG: sigma-54-dependent Fis family transcriptional regulator [Polyangiaceae bacterium]|nr:sigma-54-dependent Fis family transcriptional regulator [Polyangiaceae bacterium]